MIPSCRKGKSRWSLLCIPLLSIPPIFFEELRGVIYVTPASIISSFLILYHYPYFLKSMHTKPLYFEDLEDNGEIDDELKRKFQHIFIIVINVILAFIMGGIVDYAFYRVHNSSLNWFELTGLVGGMLSLYRSLWDYVGRFLLLVLMIKKEKLNYCRSERHRALSRDTTPIIISSSSRVELSSDF